MRDYLLPILWVFLASIVSIGYLFKYLWTFEWEPIQKEFKTWVWNYESFYEIFTDVD